MALQYNPVSLAAPSTPSAVSGWPWFFPVQLGYDVSTNFVLTPNGLAVYRPDGSCVALDDDGDALLDVTPLALTGVSPGVIRLPSALRSLRKGDLIITSDNPFSALYVLKIESESRILGLDPLSGEIVTYSPMQSLLFNMVVVATSVFQLFLFGKREDRGDDEPGRSSLNEALLAVALSQSMNPSPPTNPIQSIPSSGALPLQGGLPSWLLAFMLSSGQGGDDGGRGFPKELLLLLALSQATGSPSSTGFPPTPPGTNSTGPLGSLLPLLICFGGFGNDHKEGEDDSDRQGPGRGLRELLLVAAMSQAIPQIPVTGSGSVTPPATGGVFSNPAMLLALFGGLGFGPERFHRKDRGDRRDHAASSTPKNAGREGSASGERPSARSKGQSRA